MNAKSHIQASATTTRSRSWIAMAFNTGLLLFCAMAPAAAVQPVRVTELMTKALVNATGKEVTIITVDYAPGGAGPIHRHNASAFIYVLEGSIVMQMNAISHVPAVRDALQRRSKSI